MLLHKAQQKMWAVIYFLQVFVNKITSRAVFFIAVGTISLSLSRVHSCVNVCLFFFLMFSMYFLQSNYYWQEVSLLLFLCNNLENPIQPDKPLF